ncbi:MAG: RNA polymerase subunit sigma-24 [Chlorobi bacterium]|nr:RNA polymerase subunit sigma-24 [Chlorobiota bacterium]
MDEPSRSVFDLEDKIYHLAFRMTSSKILARELVLWTYREAGANTSRHELLRRFRAYYFSNFSIDIFSCFLEAGCKPYDMQDDSSGRFYDDIKLAVLFADMFGLTHDEIAEINGADIETLKIWLWWGRKNFFMQVREA